MESLQQTVVWINSVLSDYVLTVLLIGCGVFYTFRTRFVQFRCFGEGIRNALGRFDGVRRQSGISPFQSLMAAVAAVSRLKKPSAAGESRKDSDEERDQ